MLDDPGKPVFSRRRFLTVGLVSGALLSAGTAVMLTGSNDYYRALLPPGALEAPPRVLSPKELAILTVLVDRLIPDEDGYLTARAAQVARRLDLELTFHEEQFQSDIKAALLLIEHGRLLHGRPTRFTALQPEAQDRWIEAMATSSLELERQAVSGLRLMCLFYYYTDEKTWPKIHYAGPLLPVRKPPEASNLV